MPHRGSSDAYKYLSGFHKETPKLGSARSSANASRTSLTVLAAVAKSVEGEKDINAMMNAVNAIEISKQQAPTCITTRSAPSLSHTPITSTDDEDSSLASTPESSSRNGKYLPLRGVGTDSVAVSSAGATSSSASSVEKDLHIVTRRAATAEKELQVAVEPPTPCKPFGAETGFGIQGTKGGIAKLRAASGEM